LLADEATDPETVFVLENGTDLDRFLKLQPAPSGARRVGVVANLRPVKGLNDFVDAARLVTARHPDVVFTIAGEGECRPALEHTAAAGLAGRLQMPGVVDDIPTFLAGLHVAVLSSHAEGMSNALLEYMAAARPIVATDVGAARDLIVDGVHGLLVPPKDPGALAKAIARLLCDPGLARRLGEAARCRAQQKFSRTAMVRRFESFYDSLS
jgi:glycosyltransferase involved in cell wall biosynthesis